MNLNKNLKKNFLILLTLTNSLYLIPFAFANPVPAPPILTIYIRSDGTIDPSNVPIQHSGNMYFFTSDITNATIQIQKNDIILDGANHTLTGNGPIWDTAIILNNTDNIQIKNLNITNYVYSVTLANSTNITILNNNMITSWNILFESSENNQVIGNNITGQDKNYGYCVRLLNSSNNLIAANNLKDTGSAIRIGLTSKNNTFCQNNFLNNSNNVGAYIEEDNFEAWSNDKQGNYWSDYSGIDANNDGIGDSPYIIDDRRQDLYPLMTPYNTTNINVEVKSPSPTTDKDQIQIILITTGVIAAVIIGLYLAISKKKII